MFYYFSTIDGDDSRTSVQAQSPSTPWQTLSKLNSFFSSLLPGDSCLFKRGDVFTGSISVNKSGLSGSPITIGAYGTGDRPVISGFTTINNADWAATGFSGVYKVSVGSLSSCNAVFMDGVFQVMGKLPRGNDGYYNISSASGSDPNWTITGNTSFGVNEDFSSAAPPNIEASGGIQAGEVCYRPRHWILWRGRVTGQTGATISFTAFPSTLGGGSYSPTIESANFGFFLQNHPSLCTVLGDWSYDSAAHELYMYFGGGGPGTHVIQVPTTSDLITIASQSFIVFDNIRAEGAENSLFNLVNAPNNKVQSSDLVGSGLYGIFENGSSSNFSFLNSTMSYISSIGLRASSTANASVITGNEIHHIGHVSGMGSSGEGTYWTILNVRNGSNVSTNHIHDIGFNGVTFQGTNNIVKNNYIHDYCLVKDDAAAIYIGGQSFLGSVIDGNICLYGIGAPAGTPHQSDPRAHGIYVDDGGNNVEIKNNTCAFNGNAGINLHSSNHVTMGNNTCFDNYQNQIKYYNGAPSIDLMGTINFISNIMFAKSTEICLVSSGGTTSTASYFATADNNYWCRPCCAPGSEDDIFVTPQGNFNLASWKTFTGKEANSRSSPIAITDPADIRFEFNATALTTTVSLGADNYVDVTGVAYTGSVDLAPYSSLILLRTDSPVTPPATGLTSIIINFKPCDPALEGGYGVFYRVVGDTDYINAGNFTESPAVITGLSYPDATNIEGFISSPCGDVFWTTITGPQPPCVTKVYRARIDVDSVTFEPILTVFENTVGNIVWTHTDIGQWTGTLTNGLPFSLTWYQGNQPIPFGQGYCIYRKGGDDNTVIFELFDSANNSADDVLGEGHADIEIIVYCEQICDNPSTADASADQVFCSTDTIVVQLNGSIGGAATSATWGTSGTGTFDDNTLLNAQYTPSVDDINGGSVTLTLVTNEPGYPCVSASDEMIVTFDPPAVATFDYTVPSASTFYCQCLPSNPSCAGNPVSPNFTGGGIAGEFTCSDPNLVFFDGSPSPTGQIDIENTPPGTYTITNTVTNSCGSDVQTADITVLALPVTTFTWSTDNVMTSGEGLVNVVKTGSVVTATYSADPGLVINASTGQINCGTSTPGTYDISIVYSNASCANSTTVTVTINP